MNGVPAGRNDAQALADELSEPTPRAWRVLRLAATAGGQTADLGELLRARWDELGEGLRTELRALDELLQSSFHVGDEWELACVCRSEFAFLAALAGSDAMREASLDLNSVDAKLAERAYVEGHLDPALVPCGIPSEHWWWWAPR